MVEDIKGLIEKINQEGIRAVQGKAKNIEAQARQRAEEIVAKAQAEAEKIIAEGRDKVVKTQQSTRLSLEQTGRDLLLTLSKEINTMLNNLIARGVRTALSPQEMAKIIVTLIKNYSGKEKSDIVVLLNKQDLESLEKGLLGELKEELKKGMVLKASEGMNAGFMISYDRGRSHFDFTDKALTEYIGTYLQPKLAQILKGTSPQPPEEKQKHKQ
ncbi:MAG: hypothetical protein KKH29_05720 [Candidatus Omnitrophica bacterium]|nr:hypothetical protein [Candidatus Omnitrophota bacterium]MBU4472882.1 hypothetical protein [Candidatus Omnitrophota bacterium]MCG2706116.1 hypothetical protein [Candidatus Omnitrophota bacterium]